MDSGVLLLGPSGCGRKTFVKSLAAYLGDQRREVSISFSKDKALQSVPLTIDTKYYKCNTKIWYETVAGTIIGQESVYDDLFKEVQALVLIFDASSEESFEQVKKIAENFDFLEGSETHLVVGNMIDKSAPLGEDVFESRREWCIENGFEYVETNSLNPCINMSTMDKDGLSRVIEALQVTMWRNMEMKDQENSEKAYDHCADIKGDEHDKEQKQEQVVPSTESPETVGEVNAEKPSEKDQNDASKETEESDDDDLQALFEAVSEIKQARAHGLKSSDAERRRIAADMTLKLLGQLKWDDDE